MREISQAGLLHKLVAAVCEGCAKKSSDSAVTATQCPSLGGVCRLLLMETSRITVNLAA